MQKINRGLLKLSRPIRLVNRSLSQFGRAAGFDRFVRNLKTARGHAGNMAKSLGSVLKKLGLISGVAAGAGLALINSFATAGDRIDKTARRLGFSSEALQEWQHVAEINGVSQGLFNNSLSAFGKRLCEAKAGTGGLTTLLKRTSPALLEQLKNTESVEAAFNLYINAVGKIDDESKKAALTSAAFSRAGLPLTNIMNAGAKAIAHQREEKRRLGLIDQAGIKSAADYKDQMLRLTSAFAGVRNVIVGNVLPVINVLIGRFIELVVKLRPEIEAWATGFAKNLPQRLQRIWQGFKQVLAAIKPILQFGQLLSENMGVVNSVLAVLAVTLGASLVSALVSAGLAIKALGVALLATPVGIILAAITAIAAAVFLVIKHWEPIKDFFKSLWGDITQQFINRIEFIQSLFSRLIGGIGEGFERGIRGIKKSLLSVTNFLPDVIKNQFGLNANINSAPVTRPLNTASLNVAALGQQLRSPTQKSESTLTVQFENAPQGTRVNATTDTNTALNLALGFAMVTP